MQLSLILSFQTLPLEPVEQNETEEPGSKNVNETQESMQGADEPQVNIGVRTTEYGRPATSPATEPQ